MKPAPHCAPTLNPLVTEGVCGRLRHPQITGSILIMLGVFAASPQLISAVLFVAFVAFYIGWAFVEDRSLARIHGAAWQR
jgi:protein-S-isoprenylcysteine O-methyltransferase Ste14